MNRRITQSPSTYPEADPSGCGCEELCETGGGPTLAPPRSNANLPTGHTIRPAATTFVVTSLALLDDVVVESVSTGAQIPMKAFWYKAPVVVCFLRRFG